MSAFNYSHLPEEKANLRAAIEQQDRVVDQIMTQVGDILYTVHTKHYWVIPYECGDNVDLDKEMKISRNQLNPMQRKVAIEGGQEVLLVCRLIGNAAKSTSNPDEAEELRLLADKICRNWTRLILNKADDTTLVDVFFNCVDVIERGEIKDCPLLPKFLAF